MAFHDQRDKGNMDPTGKTTLVFLERFGKPEGGGKGVLVSEGFCPTLTATIPWVCVEETRGAERRPERSLSYPPLSSGKDIFPTLSTALAHWNSGGQEAYTGDWYIVEEILDTNGNSTCGDDD